MLHTRKSKNFEHTVGDTGPCRACGGTIETNLIRRDGFEFLELQVLVLRRYARLSPPSSGD
jgi:hypothetical protein